VVVKVLCTYGTCRREASFCRFTVIIRVSKVSRITVMVSFWIRVRYSFVIG